MGDGRWDVTFKLMYSLNVLVLFGGIILIYFDLKYIFEFPVLCRELKANK
jgi:hypothetical protein